MFNVNDIESKVLSINATRPVTGEDLPEIWGLCNGSDIRFHILLQAIWEASATNTKSDTAKLKQFGFRVDESDKTNITFALPNAV